MHIANKWGQGQIFAFSGLDGEAHLNNLVGILSADRIGIKFFTKIRRELAIVGYSANDLTFDIVSGDCIKATLDKNRHLKILFYDANTVVGEIFEGAFVTVFTEGCAKVTKISDRITITDTLDGEVTALACCGNRFCFAFDNESDKALDKAKLGLACNINTLFEEKIRYYSLNSIEDNEFDKLYSKCVSVMKTQIYSPEGRFKHHWSTPNRLPHRFLWLWDSVFHAIGHRNLDKELAQELILSVLDTQQESGIIPHMSSPNWNSDISQPPVLAWGAWKVYEHTTDKAFLKKIYNHNLRFLNWCDLKRRPSKLHLYAWKTDECINCRCGESGMDNSPRFDDNILLYAIDFSCFMANEMHYMSKIAAELGFDTANFDSKFENIKSDINKYLWDEQDKMYYDREVHRNTLHKVGSIASFLPVFAGVADYEQVKHLVKKLNDHDDFARTMPIPCLSHKNPAYGSDMWRGPVWINYNYMITEGLYRYGYQNFADEIRLSTLRMVNKWYQISGTLFEFYDAEDNIPPWCLNRKGEAVEPYDFQIRYQSIRDYGWTSTLTLDMLCNILRT